MSLSNKLDMDLVKKLAKEMQEEISKALKSHIEENKDKLKSASMSLLTKPDEQTESSLLYGGPEVGSIGSATLDTAKEHTTKVGRHYKKGTKKDRPRGTRRARRNLFRKLRVKKKWAPALSVDVGPDVTLGMVNGEWRGPKPPGDPRNWVELKPGPRGGKRWARSENYKTKGRKGGRPAKQQPGVGRGSEPAPKEPPTAGGRVEDTPTGPTYADTSQEGGGASKSAGAPTDAPVSGRRKLTYQEKLALEHVNKRLDRYRAALKAKGMEDVAGWMDLLKEHINAVGVDAALASLMESPSNVVEKLRQTRSAKERAALIEGLPPAQQEYARQAIIASAQGKPQADLTYYQGAYDNPGETADEAAFIKSYLSRAGIALIQTGTVVDPKKQVVSSQSEAQSKWLEEERHTKPGDVAPTDSTIKNKLEESKLLHKPGETEDLATIMGKPEVTKLTPDVIKKLDQKYGKGKWIVKASGSQAFSGFGVFFPEKVEEMQFEARSAVLAAARSLKGLGYSIIRGDKKEVVGIKKGKKEYKFGTDEFNSIGNQRVRNLGRKLANAAEQEHGMKLPMDPIQALREGQYGLFLTHDKTGAVVGVTSKTGKTYKIGTPEWDKINNTDGGAVGHEIERAMDWAKMKSEGAVADTKYFAEPAFEAVGVTEWDRAAGNTWETAHEGRVHATVVNGKASIIKGATFTGRADYFPAIFETPDTRAMEKAVEDAINSLPASERTGQIYAPDVLKTTKGWKVIELNPSSPEGSSLWLGENIFTIDSYVSHMVGREPMHVRFIKRLLGDPANRRKLRDRQAAIDAKKQPQQTGAAKGGGVSAAMAFNPDQPRKPAGKIGAGQWASEGELGRVHTVKHGAFKSKYSVHSRKRIRGDKLKLTNYYQQDDHSCGFVAALATAKLLDPSIHHKDVLKAVRPTKDGGIDGKRLRKAFKKLGIRAKYEGYLSIGDLRQHVKNGTPVVLTVYPKDWTSDHWVVVQGFSEDGKRIYLTNYKSLTIKQFKKEWYTKGEGLVCSKMPKDAALAIDDDREERHRLIAEILVHMFGDDAEKVLHDVVLKNKGVSAAMAVIGSILRQIHSPGPGWVHSIGPRGGHLWTYTGVGVTPHAAPGVPAMHAAAGGPASLAGRISTSSAPVAANLVIHHLQGGGTLTQADKLALATHLTNLTRPQLTALGAALGLGNIRKHAHAVKVSLIRTALNAGAAPTPVAPVRPAPAPIPTPIATPAVAARTANIPAPRLKVAPSAKEERWETGDARPGILNGIPFSSAPPKFWETTPDVPLAEPPAPSRHARAGILIQEPDGRVWIVQPTNAFGKRNYTLPGGQLESGLTDQQNALKETWEETGLQCEITGYIGDFDDANYGDAGKSTRTGRLYIGRRIGGAPWEAKVEPNIISNKTGKAAAESESVMLVSPERAAQLLHRTDDLAQIMAVHPIPIDNPTRGPGSEALKKFIHAIKPAAKAHIDRSLADGEKPGNADLKVVQDIRGFNGKPKVVSKSDMDALLAQGNHIEMLRGLSPHYNSVVGRNVTGKELADDFRDGEHFPGHGVFGSGTYCDSSKGHGNVASTYSDGGGSGEVIRIALPKSAKIITAKELQEKIPHPPRKRDWEGYLMSSGGKAPEDCWLGVQAALAGYDAIYVDGKQTKRHAHYLEGGYIILNRSILTVQKESAKGYVIS